MLRAEAERWGPDSDVILSNGTLLEPTVTSCRTPFLNPLLLSKGRNELPNAHIVLRLRIDFFRFEQGVGVDRTGLNLHERYLLLEVNFRRLCRQDLLLVLLVLEHGFSLHWHLRKRLDRLIELSLDELGSEARRCTLYCLGWGVVPLFCLVEVFLDPLNAPTQPTRQFNFANCGL